LKFFSKIEFASRERLLTPMLFSAVVLLLFAFIMPEAPQEWQLRMLVAQGMIGSFFAIQIALSRAFEAESQDRVFDMIRVSPVNSSAYIGAKIVHLALFGWITYFLTLLMASVLQGLSPPSLWSIPCLGVGALVVLGLSALGLLIGLITLKAQTKQILFPLIYFPLCTPVLIASSEFLSAYLENPVWNEFSRGWMILLLAFDAIYLTLAWLMGSEVISGD
jgi:ABC-type transport system involved in cytochrome c biogenesis permease component